MQANRRQNKTYTNDAEPRNSSWKARNECNKTGGRALFLLNCPGKKPRNFGFFKIKEIENGKFEIKFKKEKYELMLL